MFSLALIAAIAVGCPHGSGCRTCGVTYATQAYHAPTYAHAAVAEVKTLFIPSAQALYSETVGLAARQLQVEQTAADRIARLTASLDALNQRIAAVAQPPAHVAQPQPQPLPPAQLDPAIASLPPSQPQPAPTGVVPVPAPVPPQPQTLSYAAPANQPASSLDLAVKQMFSTDCKKCHTAPANGGGGYVMFQADGTLGGFDGGEIYEITERIRTGSMPRGPKRYDAGQKALVAKWGTEHASDISDYIRSLRQQASR